jgi:hypothetical protein
LDRSLRERRLISAEIPDIAALGKQIDEMAERRRGLPRRCIQHVGNMLCGTTKIIQRANTASVVTTKKWKENNRQPPLE